MIVIDEDVYRDNGMHEGSNEIIVVTGHSEPARVIEALEKAGDRMLTIDDEGHVHADANQAALAGAYTPNYVSTPTVTDRGIEMYLDAKGSIGPEMADALRRVLREELERVVADARVSAVV
ncbi:hypothetical protein [Nocardioides sp. Soil805]|uniref:hypothetical protein n=1 Tax=Nocardioides sp. Soil805 TaxID=1736416 RepID=UPI0007026F73|nr:hypothetical protein [Nocardioides sp. Soil805]KRF36595.1 hypothetical protein ASG94_03950 [Nocardioides sp. Soil805]